MNQVLARFAVSAFHQDWDLDWATPDDAAIDFLRRASADTLSGLFTDMEALSAGSWTDEQLEDLWINKFHASYSPRDDGLTYREWFAHVRDLLTQAKSE